MSGHNRASDLGQPQKGVDFSGRFLKFIGGAPENGLKGFGKGALAIDSQNGRLYMNTGSELSATWSEVAGSSYMSDPQGIAPLMYGGKANVLILGDSIHNWNTAFNQTSGFHPMMNAHTRKWKPNKWSGMGVPLTTGSATSGFKNKASSGLQTSYLGAKPGQLTGTPEYQFYTPGPGFLLTVNSANTAGTYALSTLTDYRLFQPFAQLLEADPTATPRPLDRHQQGLITLGRSQNLPLPQVWIPPPGAGTGSAYSMGTTDSTYWLNTAGQEVTYKTTVYTHTSGGLSEVHARAKAVDAFSSQTDSNNISIGTGFTTFSVNAPAVTDDNMDNEFGCDICSGNSTGTIMPICFSIQNEAITDGMLLTYAGSGGWSIENHAAFNASSAPSADSITNPWYETSTLSRIIQHHDINIVMVYISNTATSSAAEEQAMADLNTRIALAASLVGMATPKIVFCTTHPIGGGSAGSGETRANRIMKNAAINGNSYIDLYHAAQDDGHTESTVIGDGFHLVTDPVHHTEDGANYYSQKIWDIITGTAS